MGIQINLRRDGRRPLKCPDCGKEMAVNRVRHSVAFDLGCGAGPVAIVKYPITQGKFSSCGCYHSFRRDADAGRSSGGDGLSI